MKTDSPDSRVSVGYTFLARSHWGGKFNRELKTLMLTHAFKFIRTVVFDVGEHNMRSRRAVEKIGAGLVRMQMNKGQPYTVYEIDEAAFLSTLAGQGA